MKKIIFGLFVIVGLLGADTFYKCGNRGVTISNDKEEVSINNGWAGETEEFYLKHDFGSYKIYTYTLYGYAVDARFSSVTRKRISLKMTIDNKESNFDCKKTKKLFVYKQ